MAAPAAEQAQSAVLAPTLRLHPRPKYLSLALTAMQRAIAYRTAILLGLVTNTIWVVILYYLWRSVFAANAELGGFNWVRMRTYIVVSFSINALLSWYIEGRIFRTIRNGNIAVEIMRPLDYMRAQLAQASGAALVEGGLSGATVFLLGLLVLRIELPASPAAAALFLVSVALGFLVKFLISYLTALLCFWTLNDLGLRWARSAVTNIFSGALIPIQFFPGWLRTLALLLPFRSIVHTPLSIYQDALHGDALWQGLLAQLLWVLLLWLVARLLWIPSIRKLTVQGG